ncbi:MAG: hypothetical protein IJ706_08090 [Clostridia bacterium]|nr:hypothetical protein [Clostridia bacterium]
MNDIQIAAIIDKFGGETIATAVVVGAVIRFIKRKKTLNCRKITILSVIMSTALAVGMSFLSGGFDLGRVLDIALGAVGITLALEGLCHGGKAVDPREVLSSYVPPEKLDAAVSAIEGKKSVEDIAKSLVKALGGELSDKEAALIAQIISNMKN